MLLVFNIYYCYSIYVIHISNILYSNIYIYIYFNFLYFQHIHPISFFLKPEKASAQYVLF